MWTRLKELIATWAPVIGLMASVSLLSGTVNPAPQTVGIFVPDKLAHFLVFGLISTLFYRNLLKHSRAIVATILAIVFTSLFGFLDELNQSTTPGRYMEFDDWIADTAGAIVAAYAYRYLKWYRTLLEFRLTLKRRSKNKAVS